MVRSSEASRCLELGLRSPNVRQAILENPKHEALGLPWAPRGPPAVGRPTAWVLGMENGPGIPPAEKSHSPGHPCHLGGPGGPAGQGRPRCPSGPTDKDPAHQHPQRSLAGTPPLTQQAPLGSLGTKPGLNPHPPGSLGYQRLREGLVGPEPPEGEKEGMSPALLAPGTLGIRPRGCGHTWDPGGGGQLGL